MAVSWGKREWGMNDSSGRSDWRQVWDRNEREGPRSRRGRCSGDCVHTSKFNEMYYRAMKIWGSPSSFLSRTRCQPLLLDESFIPPSLLPQLVVF